jgi:predicted N-acetyltransferase YhbS
MVSTTGSELDDVETRILEYFEERESKQAHTKEIAEGTGITRHTAAKYLSVLEAKGRLGQETVGNAKVWYPISREIDIRTLTIEDFDEIIAIAKQIHGGDEEEAATELPNLRTELRAQLADDNRFCVGTETEGEIVGFIIGDERSWEFGSSEQVGWIRILGVHPNFQSRGIGRLLGDEILQRFEEAGVERVRTIVGWDESDLLPFFHSLDFGMKEAAVLEKSLDIDREHQANNDHQKQQ